MKAVKTAATASHTASPHEELWNSFRQGSREAFARIYHDHVDNLYHYGVHLCGDGELVRDCLQELFHDLWQSREHLSEQLLNIRYYLLSSLRRRLLRTLERDRRSRVETTEIPFDFELIPSPEHAIIQDERQQEQVRQLHSALNALPRRQREAIYLRFFHELSYEEVADMMSMKVDSVYNIISRAIGVLRKTLPPAVLLLLMQPGK
ncbi:sigma-70 family RNA polymerase sigma factor [Chitinophaga filiformis]|uniref:RNA polymerase sigma factor n=1 Tax=Chitinophaga filiformis TaxID=104663 RepID=UPI001F32B15F|nr:sigma-70 family RNA polymerase sigma factor [Chitinophaga filiformis]MCF6402875.1 sigma-70 family RNA polymerase sigma factor [Chitinophaga filiformis]MCF6403207.1 sigma-70 family RNA polymerase sigma factor [Chitinophaga filiformis]